MSTCTSKPRGEVTVDSILLTVTATLVTLTILGEASGDEPARLLVLDIVAGAVSTLLMPVLARRPVTGGLALSVVAAISPAGTPGATIAAVNVAWRRRFTPAAWVSVAGVAAHLLRWVWRPYPGLTFAWWVVLVIAGYAALLGWGSLSQARRALIKSLRDRAIRAEAEQGRRIAEARAAERAAIAREMHDVLAHRLSLLATYAGALEHRPDAPAKRRAEAAGVIRAGVHAALDELRDVIAVLRDDSTDGVGDRPQPTAADIPRLVEESVAAGMRVDLSSDVEGVPSPTIGRTAYRVVQEGLTNARKHAPGEPVRLELRRSTGNDLLIVIRNATGASVHPEVPGSGTGLVGLTERVRLIGGQLDHELLPDRSFVLSARLPWRS